MQRLIVESLLHESEKEIRSFPVKFVAIMSNISVGKKRISHDSLLISILLQLRKLTVSATRNVKLYVCFETGA